jgi:aminoglycoside phosphotransferase (APT) family kinase protein
MAGEDEGSSAGADDRTHLESAPGPGGLARLTEHLGGRRVSDVVRLAGGLDCATHAFTLDGERLVLKRSKPGATTAGIEFENLRYASRSSVATPEPVALDEAGTWFGTPALVMTALPGSANLFPADLDRWVRQLAAALAAVHDTPAADFPIRRPPAWQRWTPWTDEIDGRMVGIIAAVASLREVAAGETVVFTHDDYHPGNAVFVGHTLTGVVDWSHTAMEPRQAAVAYCRKDLAIHPGGDAPDRFLAAYEAEIGFPLEHMALWDVLYGSRAMQWGHRWPPSFAELGVPVSGSDIARISAAFVDAALTTSGP